MVTVIAVLVLIGWVADFPQLRRVQPDTVEMKINTAVALLLLAWDVRSPRSRISVIGVVVATAIGVLTTVEWVAGLDLRIDEALMLDYDQGAAHPGRPAMATGIALSLLGLSSLSRRLGRPVVSQVAAVGAGTTAWLALVGYGVEADLRYGFEPLATMAPHTAASLGLLTFGALASVEQGVLRWMANGVDVGAMLARRTAPVLFVVVPTAALLGTTGNHRGWWDRDFGTVVTLSVLAVAGLAVIASTGRAFHRVDLERQAMSRELQGLNLELERRVADRTSELALEKARAETLAATAPVGIFNVDRQGSCTYVNGRWEEIHDLDAAHALGNGWVDRIHPLDMAEVLTTWNETGTADERTAEYRIIRGDGTVRLVRGHWAPVTRDGLVTGYTGTVEDITDRRLAEEQFRVAFELSPSGMILLDAVTRRFLKVNREACRIAGRTSEDLLGRVPYELLHGDDVLTLVRPDETFPPNFEARLVRPDGECRWVSVQIVPIDSPTGELRRLVQLADIHDARMLRLQLEHLATHDGLTGLLNRRGFETAFDRHRALVGRYRDSGALLVVDLDRFKWVNDSFGHKAGDEVIRAAADALHQRLRDSDLLGRLGGDEFAVLVPRGGRSEAEAVADAIVHAISTTVVSLDGDDVRLSASVGVHVLTDADVDAFVQADQALYEAKRRGRGQWVASGDPETEVAEATSVVAPAG